MLFWFEREICLIDVMGVLSTGRPLTWSEISQVRSILKTHALNDLILIWKKHRSRTNDDFLWGDEIEYTLVRFDHQNQRVQLLLKAHEILSKINQLRSNNQLKEVLFHAEDCNFVVEGIPSKPYSCFLIDYTQVELNMKLRRNYVQELLDENESIVTISLFPRLGCVECTYPSYKSNPKTSFENSICCSDQFKSPNHPRTMFLNKNVIERRQNKVSVNVPIYQDLKTANPFIDDFSCYEVENWEEHVEQRLDNHIHLDSSSIGWGCCCLQVTFQCSSFQESTYLYDQLIPLTPIFLSLSSSCPLWRGYVSDIDSRWNILSATTDDRTKEEIEIKLHNSSRYSSVNCYLSLSSEIYNDIHFNIDQQIYESLISNDCPTTVARHFANIFLRDPLYVTDQQVYQNEKNSNKLFAFENQNSMVWNSLRFKPPPSSEDDDYSLGWRIEFRPMELQITDFENAAFSVFLSLLTRAILSYRIDLRMLISLVHENMHKAQQRNTIQLNQFHFPTNISSSSERSTRLMTIDEIINGSIHFIGLKTLVVNYLNSFETIDISTRVILNKYLNFIGDRAKGQSPTNAMWIRQFVQNHPKYQHDSIVNEQIQYDFISKIQQINHSNDKIFSFIR